MQASRRKYLQFLGLAGLGTAAGLVAARADSLSTWFGRSEQRISRSQAALGTRVDITAVGCNGDILDDAIGAAFEDMREMEKVFTRFGSSSPVCEINADGALDRLPAPLASMMTACRHYHDETNGAFDITVKPIIDLFRAHRNSDNPSETEIADAVRRTGMDKMSFRGGGASIGEGMGITLDGAAPGFIADRASEILLAHGVSDFLVNAGGEIRTSGHARGGNMWRVAIQDPEKNGHYPGILTFSEGAVSTSGNYEIYYDDERMFHHIVDARTGHSPANITSVTVTARTALEADILSTALYVMSPSEALSFAASHDGVDCLIIDKNGRRYASQGMKQFT